jgi:hypothetical protein
MARAGLALWLALFAPAATAEAPQTARLTDVVLVDPTPRYAHGVLGDAMEWGGLRLTVLRQTPCNAPTGLCAHHSEISVTLPENRVFEDVDARLVDVHGTGQLSVMVVETDVRLGASLALYDAQGRAFAATPFIGQPNRWLAPVGVGDFDRDGRVEIAYVDRPHLLRDLTNHQIGDAAIAGGVRRCAGGDQAIVASADWTRALAVTLIGGVAQVTDLGPISGPADLAGAMACTG